MNKLSGALIGTSGLALLALLLLIPREPLRHFWRSVLRKPGSRSEQLINTRTPMLRRGVLMLAMEGIQDAELHEILQSPRVPELELLDVQENQLTADGVKRLAEEPKLRRVRHLALSGNPIGDAGARALATAPFLGEIKELFVARIGLGTDGARALGEALRKNRLRLLDAGHQPLGEAAILALASVPSERLRLQGVGLAGGTALRLLTEAACRGIDLQDNALGSGALAGLSALSASLELIDLTNTGLGAQDAAALSRLHSCNLHTLVLARCPLGDAGLTALSHAPWLGQLKLLSLVGTHASAAATQTLQATFGYRDGLLL